MEIICCEGTDFKNYIASSIYYGILDNPTNYNLNGFKLPAATLSGISEPRVCRYKATVCSPLLCKRPDIVATPAPTTVALKDSSVPQLVPIMKHINSTCLTKQEDWWTYELCFNSGVRQVRYETEQSLTADGKLVLKQSLVSQYQLGLAPLALYTNETELKKLVM